MNKLDNSGKWALGFCILGLVWATVSGIECGFGVGEYIAYGMMAVGISLILFWRQK